MDTSRAVSAPQPTLGADIYEVLCHQVSRAEDPLDVEGKRARKVCHDGVAPDASYSLRVRELHAQRGRLIEAMDAILNTASPAQRNGVLDALLPVLDRGTVRQQIQALHRIFKKAALRPEVFGVLARVANHPSYRSAEAPAGMLSTILQSTQLTSVVEGLAGAFGPQGPGKDLPRQIQQALYGQFSTAVPDQDASHLSALAGLRNVLLAELPVEGSATASPHWAVVRDARGLPMPQQDEGQWHAPLVDKDGDGLADVDATGRFVDAAGQPIALLGPFGADPDATSPPADTRPRWEDGSLIYQYRDLNTTVLAALLNQLRDGVARAPEQALALTHVIQALFGVPQTQPPYTFPASGYSMPYEGFDASRSPLVELAQVGGWLAQKPQMLQLVDVLHTLWREQEPVVAYGLKFFRDIGGILQHAEKGATQLKPHTNVGDDMLDYLVELASVDGLLEDLGAALLDPQTQRLGPLLAQQMRLKDAIDFNLETINGPPVGTLQTPVDRTQRDVPGNRSVLQRLLHLVYDASGLTLCNKAMPGVMDPEDNYQACELFNVEDVAAFYVKAIAGEARLTLYPLTGHDLEDNLTAENPEIAAAGMSALEGITFIRGLKPVPTRAEECPEEKTNPPVSIPAERSPPASCPPEGSSETSCPREDSKGAFRAVWYAGGDPAGGNGPQVSSEEDPLGRGNASGDWDVPGNERDMPDDDFPPVPPPTGPRPHSCLTFEVTPQAAARLFFVPYDERFSKESSYAQDHQMINQSVFPMIHVGDARYHELHRGTLFAWEQNDFFGAIRPIIQAFTKHNRADLAVKLFNILHVHWDDHRHHPTQKDSTALKPSEFMPSAGLVTLEPVMAQVLDEGKGLTVLAQFLSAVQSIQTQDGTQTGAQALVDALRHLIHPELNNNLRRLNDNNKILKGDGKTPVASITPVYMLKKAFKDGLDNLHPALQSRASQALRDVTGQALQVQATSAGYRFSNRQVQALGTYGLKTIRDYLTAHQNTPKTEPLGNSWGAHMYNAVAHPIPASVVQVLTTLDAHEPARRLQGEILSTLFSEHQGVVLSSAAEAIDLLAYTPQLRSVWYASGPIWEPEHGLIDTSLVALKDLVPAPEGLQPERLQPERLQKVAQLVEAWVKPAPDQTQSPLGTLVDVFIQVNRQAPGYHGPVVAGDFQTMLLRLHNFLLNEQDGIGRLMSVVENRHGKK